MLRYDITRQQLVNSWSASSVGTYDRILFILASADGQAPDDAG